MQGINRNHSSQIDRADIDKDETENAKQAARKAVNPYASPYYNDSMSSSSSHTHDLSVSEATAVNQASSKANGAGWNHVDTISKATTNDIDIVAKPAAPKEMNITDSLTLTSEKLDPKEVETLLEKNYNLVSPKIRAEVDAIVAQPGQGTDMLRKHMEALSKKIDDALNVENRDYEKIHAMVLRFCMIHMRNVSKDDQEYIAKIGDQIKIQAGKIRDSYNTWPVVTITLVSSGVSIVGGVAGFSTLFSSSTVAEHFAKNAQQISTTSTGISGVGSLFNSRNEGDRQILQLYMKRDQDKEEEKKGSKHGNKESQKLFRTAIEEFFRNIRETISSILRG